MKYRYKSDTFYLDVPIELPEDSIIIKSEFIPNYMILIHWLEPVE